ncbi:MAG TPA: L,D-transpeptidase [Gaiellaceae bacterium]|nr:L,D-transpeptidase [Gaiellaceae bacterium]
MKRFATLISLAAAIAAIAAAASAHAGSSATRAGGVVLETKFPAAGALTVNSVVVRRKPSTTARKIKTMKYFRPDYRVQEILAVASATAPNGTPWYRISVPMRPNGTYGWIPAADVTLSPTAAQIVVNVSARTIDVFRHGKRVLHAQVAVGAPGMETPLGHYYVAAAFKPVNDPFLGVWALETSAYSKLTDWPGGGVVGIHGTNMPWLLGKAVSHGCVRVSNTTAAALKRLAPAGTPIVIKG